MYYIVVYWMVFCRLVYCTLIWLHHIPVLIYLYVYIYMLSMYIFPISIYTHMHIIYIYTYIIYIYIHHIVLYSLGLYVSSRYIYIHFFFIRVFFFAESCDQSQPTCTTSPGNLGTFSPSISHNVMTRQGLFRWPHQGDRTWKTASYEVNEWSIEWEDRSPEGNHWLLTIIGGYWPSRSINGQKSIDGEDSPNKPMDGEEKRCFPWWFPEASMDPAVCWRESTFAGTTEPLYLCGTSSKHTLSLAQRYAL